MVFYLEPIESRIREHAKLENDIKILQLSDEDLHHIVMDIARDVLIEWEEERSFRMENERKIELCKSLCNMFQALLICAYELDRLEQLIKHLFVVADACHVVYREKKKSFFFAYFYLYNANDISIEVHGLGEEVSGYVNDINVCEIDLPEYIIDAMNGCVKIYWDEMKDKTTFEFVEKYDEEHIVVNILS